MTAATPLKHSSGVLKAPSDPNSESKVDRDSHFNGLYETRQNLRIEGIAEGEIRCEGTLTVAEGARVKAKVTASAMAIAGELEGEVICQGVFQIMPTGQVSATVSARKLSVQEGGFYNGEFHMIVDEPAGSRVSKGSKLVETPKDAASAAILRPGDSMGTDEWWAKMTSPSSAAPGPNSDSKPA